MNLEQQKKRAREFLVALRSGNQDALVRLRHHHARWTDATDEGIRQLVALHDAQFVLAREQGFASWPKLKAYAEPASTRRNTRLFVADLAWLDGRAQGLVRTHQSAVPAALEQIREWHPRFAACTDEEIRQAPFDLADARLVYAREHGFDSWADLALRVSSLASNPQEAVEGEAFLSAFNSLKSGNLVAFEALLHKFRDLAYDRGTNGNTLLNLSVSLQSLAAVKLLLSAGADANEPNDRGSTPLHQAAYSNHVEIAALLLEHRAALDAEAHGAGGTPLIFALFWGHREVAALLAAHSFSPANLRVAAGLGRPELVEACFDSSGSLTREACAARGFYRPHSGFPDWQPSNDRQQLLDEALVWACKSNRVAVLPKLVAAGANVNADPYRGTPLIWAAACNRIDAAAWLIDHGARIDQKATFGGLSHGQGITALHIAAQYGHMPVVQLLLERGADRSITDDLYQATAERAANHFGQHAVRDYLRQG